MTTTALRRVSLDKLRPDPENPRADATPTDEMIESVREGGIFLALLVRSDGDGFVIVDGERRWRAGLAAELRETDVIVVDGWTTERVVAAQIATGIHQADLNPVEQARALRRLVESAGVSQRAASAMTGLSQATVSRLLRLLTLTPQIQARVAAGEIGVSQALGYDRAPSQRLTSRGGINPTFDELRTHVTALGRALLKDADDEISTAALAAYRVLSRWLPSDVALGGEPGEPSTGPTVRCPYCRDSIPVEHPAGTKERSRAHNKHHASSETCRLRHEREMRRAGLTG